LGCSNEWVIPLSGGYDSRMLLLMLHKTHPDAHCVTWGTEESLNNRYSDAYIARKLCETLGVKHDFFPVNISEDSVETLFSRFVANGEGRIDHMLAYLDGFDLWKRLYEQGVRGIVRGDECFGSRILYSELDFRKFSLATMLSDYEEFQEMGLPPSFDQTWPTAFRRGPQETLEVWRDRLYAEYLFPYYLGALNELKLGYVEIVNPFACERIIQRVRRIPDKWRNEKRLYREIVESYLKEVPIAKFPAIDICRGFLRSRRVNEFLIGELHSDRCRDVLPEKLLRKTAQNVQKNHVGSIPGRLAFFNKIRPFISPKIVKKVQKLVSLKERIDYFDIALRCCIISYTTDLLGQDASALSGIQDINDSDVIAGRKTQYGYAFRSDSHYI